jgi:hypothetical protein
MPCSLYQKSRQFLHMLKSALLYSLQYRTFYRICAKVAITIAMAYQNDKTIKRTEVYKRPFLPSLLSLHFLAPRPMGLKTEL